MNEKKKRIESTAPSESHKFFEKSRARGESCKCQRTEAFSDAVAQIDIVQSPGSLPRTRSSQLRAISLRQPWRECFKYGKELAER